MANKGKGWDWTGTGTLPVGWQQGDHWNDFYSNPAPKPIGNTTMPQSPGEGFAWYGDPKGKGRWGIDPESDRWDSSDYDFSDIFEDQKAQDDKYRDSEEWRIKQSLPHWFGFSSYNPETQTVRGYTRYGGTRGVLTQGGDMTSEYYGQPGSWSFHHDRRPDGSIAHVVGDYYWGLQNQGKNLGEWQSAPNLPYWSTDPQYLKSVQEQKDRMRSDIMDKVIEGDDYAPMQLANWDFKYGKEDFAKGKHFTQDLEKEEFRANKRKRLRDEKQGIVRGAHETDRPSNTAPTLTERLGGRAGAKQRIGDRETPSFNIEDPFGVGGVPESVLRKYLQGAEYAGKIEKSLSDLDVYTVLPKGTQFNPAHQSNIKLTSALQNRYGTLGKMDASYQRGQWDPFRGTGVGDVGDSTVVSQKFGDIEAPTGPNIKKRLTALAQGKNPFANVEDLPKVSLGWNYFRPEVAMGQNTPYKMLQGSDIAGNIGKWSKGAIKAASNIPAARRIAGVLTGGPVGAALTATDTALRASQGDYIGSALSAAEGTAPGLGGAAAFGANIIGDLPGVKSVKGVANKAIHKGIIPFLGGDGSGRSGYFKVPEIKSNKAMKGKSLGNVGGRNIYEIPSFNQF